MNYLEKSFMLKIWMPKLCKQSTSEALQSLSRKIRSEVHIASIITGTKTSTTSLLFPEVLQFLSYLPRLLLHCSGKENTDLERLRQNSGLVDVLPGSINHRDIYMLSARYVLAIYLHNGCPKICKYKYLLSQEISDGNFSTHLNQYRWHLNVDDLKFKNSKILTILRFNQKKLILIFRFKQPLVLHMNCRFWNVADMVLLKPKPWQN